MTTKSITSLWGDFEELEPEVDTEKVKVEEEDHETETDLDEEEKESPDSQGVEKKENTEPPEKDEEKKPDDNPVVAAFDAIADGLETEDLLFIGDDKVYEPTADGFKAMMKDNMEAYKLKVEKEFSEKENQIRKEYENKGTPSIMDMDPENEEHAEKMLKAYYKEIGLDEDEITEKIKDVKLIDNLEKEAKLAQRVLGKKEKQEREAAEAAETKAKEDKIKEVQTYINEMKSYIDETEEMAGFKLSPKIKKGFKEYLFSKDKDGLTPAQKAGKDPERRLRLAFLDYMDFNKNDFEIKAKTELARGYSKKVSRFTSTQAQSKGITIKQEEEKEGLQPGFTDFWSPSE